MSISVKEIVGKSGSIDSQWQRTYKRVFRCITTDPGDGPATIREALPVSLGMSYAVGNDVDKGAFCLGIEVAHEANAADGLSFLATCSYGPYNPALFPQSPLEQPIRLNWTRAQYQRPLDKDEDDTPVVNSSGETFDPPLERDDSRQILTIVRNERTDNVDQREAYADAINSDPFWGKPPFSAKVKVLDADYQFNPDVGWFYVKTYQFEFRKEGWRRKILDAGFRTRDPSDGSITNLIDKKGQPLSRPALLDGNGQKLAEGADPVYLEFKEYPELPFDVFNLDPSQLPGNAP